MARPLRLEYAGAWYHVTGRGNERRAIFRDDRDREKLLQLLGELETRYGLEIHAYVLMGNHYHFLIRLQGKAGLSVGMQWLAVSYTIWFNRRHRRAGHLFQGRYKAVIVDFDEWGCELSRYIHLNPIRTKRHGLGKDAAHAERRGLGERPSMEVVRERLKALDEYRWSSYGCYVGLRKPPSWLHNGEILSSFGRGVRGRRSYREYVQEAIRSGYRDSPWEEVQAGFVLGGEELVEKVREMIRGNPKEQSGLKKLRRGIQLDEIVDLVSELKNEPWEAFSNRKGDWGRDMVLMLARRHAGMSNKELGEWLGGLDDSTVAQAVRRLKMRLGKESQLGRIHKRLESKMSYAKT